MAVIFKKVGATAILSADAEVRTKQGILEVNLVEIRRLPKGTLNGLPQISLGSEADPHKTACRKPKPSTITAKATAN